MSHEQDQILSYRDMCDAEGVQTLQRGMNFRLNPKYSVLLMSQRSNAPYQDRVHPDGVTIEYEGHDIARRGQEHNPKAVDQPQFLGGGRRTQNGLFVKAIEDQKTSGGPKELVKIYEKVQPGVWSIKGYFDLIDYSFENSGERRVFKFTLRLSERSDESIQIKHAPLEHSRVIPSSVKMEVWVRDSGRCVLCGDNKNIHFDHDLPYSKGGTSLSALNVRILCAKHNLQKSDKIQ